MSKYKPRRQIIAELKDKKKKQLKTNKKIAKTNSQFKEIELRFKNNFGKFIDIANKLVKSFFKKTNRFGHRIVKVLNRGFELVDTFLQNLLTDFVDILSKLSKKWLWPCRFLFLIVFLIGLTSFNFLKLYERFPNQALTKSIQAINFWPNLPLTHLQMAQASFDLGYSSLAQKHLQTARAQINALPFLDQVLSPIYKQTNSYLETPAKKKWLLEKINQQLEEGPYSVSLLLYKAQLELELWQEKSAQQDYEVIKWLDPLFESTEIEKFLK